MFKKGDTVLTPLGYGTVTVIDDLGVVSVSVTDNTHCVFSEDDLKPDERVQKVRPGLDFDQRQALIKHHIKKASYNRSVSNAYMRIFKLGDKSNDRWKDMANRWEDKALKHEAHARSLQK